MKYSEKAVAVLDSGVGGITVLERLQTASPHENYIYHADVQNAPYGDKSRDEIASSVEKSVRFLSKMGLKGLVIACNTATSAVIDKLRNDYEFPIIGMEPAIKPALSTQKEGLILVLATRRTLREKKFRHLVIELGGIERIKTIAMGRLVEFAENYDFHSDDLSSYLKRHLAIIDAEDISCIVLGCTHFVYFQDQIRSHFDGRIPIFTGVEGTVREVLRRIEKNPLQNIGRTRLFLSEHEADPEFLKPYINRLRGTSPMG